MFWLDWRITYIIDEGGRSSSMFEGIDGGEAGAEADFQNTFTGKEVGFPFNFDDIVQGLTEFRDTSPVVHFFVEVTEEETLFLGKKDHLLMFICLGESNWSNEWDILGFHTKFIGHGSGFRAGSGFDKNHGF